MSDSLDQENKLVIAERTESQEVKVSEHLSLFKAEFRLVMKVEIPH